MPCTETDQDMSDLGWTDRVRQRTNFKNDHHALKTGMFIVFLRDKWGYADIVLDTDGNYTPRIEVRGGLFGKVTIEVLPPGDDE